MEIKTTPLSYRASSAWVYTTESRGPSEKLPFAFKQEQGPLPLEDLRTAFQEFPIPDSFQGVVFLAQGDQILYQRAGGVAHLEKGDSISSSSQFLIGSVSKQFTAAALLKALWTQHPSLPSLKNSLQSPISTYLPADHPIWQGKAPPWIDTVTLHQLLTHTSGIVNFTETPAFQEASFYEQRHTPDEVIDLIKGQNLLFTPGTQQSYSNTNYFLLSEIVSALTQTPFSQFLQEQFFQPLEMAATDQPPFGNSPLLQSAYPAFVEPLQLDPSGQLAPLNTAMDLSLAQGCGGIVSTAEDLWKWNVALHEKQTVLPPEVYELMITDYTSSLGEEAEGYGLGIQEFSSGIIYGHQGRLETHNAMLLYAPQGSATVIILSNQDEGYQLLVDTLTHILDTFSSR